ncbi:MAG TPA: PEP-CTERM sorting domain-containing protein [Phycisphaerae bacterium]|nr:PEP-CTERM sorting domain-containing protein [Phycisphaerae bacterium]
MRTALLVVWHALVRRLAPAATVCAVLLVTAPASAQYVAMPDSTNNRLVYFDPFDGSVVNPNVFPLAAGTPIHAIQVGNEIWVSEQIGDRISRWDLSGTPVGAITGALDNLRGMALANGIVYLCNDGTGNGAPGASLHMFDPNGNNLGFFPTPSSSPFAILDFQNSLLVASDAANDDIHRYSYAGASLGTFHNSTGLNFAEQMDYATNGDILVAGFSTNNIVRLNPADGSIISSFAASGARGVYQLGNGNILWTNSGGAHVYDGTTSTQVYAGGGRFLQFIPEPTSLSLLGFGGALLLLRRRG